MNCPVDGRTVVRRVYFHDNVHLKSGVNGNEYFAVHVADPEEPIRGVTPYVCRISRYIVPGRCDFYSFAENEGKILFWTETNMPLSEATKRAAADLQRANVISLILSAGPKLPYLPRHSLAELIHALSPKGRLVRLIEASKKPRNPNEN